MSVVRLARTAARLARSLAYRIALAFPIHVECNVCGWRGRSFLDDPWQKRVACPKCDAGIRQRLFVAALREIDGTSSARLIRGKRVLHFAPERCLTPLIRGEAGQYVTADYLRRDCDRRLDMSAMPEVASGSFDAVIAFDVLEHVPDYQTALAEVWRVTTPGGVGIFTVPQKDGLDTTDEDCSVATPEERTRRFGQWDHLRIFGDDFAAQVQSHGFAVTIVDASAFPPELVRRHVLFPPVLSTHPLATNYRKVFFARKM